MPRRFGKFMMAMFAFGSGTHSDQAVSVASKSYTNGLSGIWYQWLWLFVTPFYWITPLIFRRMRYITTADYDEDGTRLLKDLELWEVSVVSLPMNPLARIQHVKSRLSERGEYVPTPREFEQALRDVGCSQKVAKTIMSKIMHDEDGTRDVDPEARDVRSQADAETMKAAVAVANKLEALLISDAASKLFK